MKSFINNYRTLSIRAVLSLGIAFGGLIGTSQTAFSAESVSEEELYTICSKYPHNSHCEGYSIPVPLSNRAGQEGVCALNDGQLSIADRCKLLIEEGAVSVYIEQGDRITAIENQRRTIEVSIPMEDINQLSYGEGESVNTGRVIANTLLWGALGAALTKPDKVSQVEITFFQDDAADVQAEPNSEELNVSVATIGSEGYIDGVATSESATTEIDETIDISETTPEVSTPNNPYNNIGDLTFETGRSNGQTIRDQLEERTGLVSRTSL